MPSLGATGLKNPRILPAGEISGLTTGDVNLDGKLDLVFAERGSPATLVVMLGDGLGGFQRQAPVSLAIGLCAYDCKLTIANLNGDASPDVLTAGNNSQNGFVAVLPGNGDGTFGAMIKSDDLTGGNFPGFGIPAIGDVNRDSFVDVAVSDVRNNRFYVLFGDGTGYLRIGTNVSFGGTSKDHLYDLDGDGKLDRISFGAYGGSSSALGNGDGTFQYPTYYNGAGSWAFGDIDGDTRPDLVLAGYPKQINLYKGRADGGFDPSSKICDTSTPLGISFMGEFTGDGRVDLFASSSLSGVSVLPVGADLSCSAIRVSAAPPAEVNLRAIGDFNQDSKLDVAVVFPGGLAILMGKGDGSFESADSYDLGQTVGSGAAVADFNQDGRLDIALGISQSVVRLLLNQGGGVFQLGANPNIPDTQSDSVWAAGDFDGDGKADLITGAYGYAPRLMYGNGDGTFLPPLDFPEGFSQLADINQDGRTDILTLSGDAIAVHLGQGNRTFNRITTPLRNAGFASLVGVSDLNNDGKLDVLVGGNRIIEVWIGQGNGAFHYHNVTDTSSIQLSSMFSENLRLADLDQDGKTDVVFAVDGQPTLAFLYGNGNGTLQPAVLRPVSRSYPGLRVADLDQDGKPDLVLYLNGGLATLRNLGAREFDQEAPWVAGAGINRIEVADLTGDGLPDIVVPNYQAHSVTVLLNGDYPSPATISAMLTVSPSPSDYAQPFTIDFTAAPRQPADPIPSGLVSLKIKGVLYGTTSLVQGKASFTVTSTLFPGDYSLVLDYAGDGFYRPSGFIVSHHVRTQFIATETTLTVSPLSVYTSQTVRLIATVTTAGSRLNGAVTFFAGNTTLRTTSLLWGPVAVADIATLPPGLHQIKAVYHGIAHYDTYLRETYLPSSSGAVTVAVESYPTQTSLVSSTTTAVEGTIVTLTATVSSGMPPFGAVTFFDALTPLGTVPVRADGTAVLSTSAIRGRGPHGIFARFSANSVFAASESASVIVGIQPTPSSLVRTVVALSQTPQGGDLALTATVSTGTTGAAARATQATVTFLGDGRVLGVMRLDDNGHARLLVDNAQLAKAYQASFSGDDTLAPSASPELRSSTTPPSPFWIQVESVERHLVAGRGSVRVIVHGVNEFAGDVRLECDGLPADYACTFTPPLLHGGGASTLRIHHSAAPKEASMPVVFVALSLVIMMLVPRRGAAFVLIACITVGVGCGGGRIKAPVSSTSVITINATCGSQSSSTQIAIIATFPLD